MMLFAILLLGIAEAAGQQTCGDIKDIYKSNTCCGQPSKLLNTQEMLLTAEEVEMVRQWRETHATGTWYWTKHGLDQIPFADWHLFSDDGVPYLATAVPLPGDNFTVDHLNIWKMQPHLAAFGTTYEELAAVNVVSRSSTPVNVEVLPATPPIPFREDKTLMGTRIMSHAYLQHATNLEEFPDVTYLARLGVGWNGGNQLENRREFAAYPDQCDATPIARNLFILYGALDQTHAFYSDTKVGMFQHLFDDVVRRPFDDVNAAVSGWYAWMRVERALYGMLRESGWAYSMKYLTSEMQMIGVGLDINDTSMDVATPIGLGNVVGKRVAEWMRAHDGLKEDMGFVDESRLMEIHDYHHPTKWYQWSPTLAGSGRFQYLRSGIVTQQTFVSPSLGITSYLYSGDADYASLGFGPDTLPPMSFDNASYLQRARDFMDAQRNLTEEQKVLAELMNNKVEAVGVIMNAVWYSTTVGNDIYYVNHGLLNEVAFLLDGIAEYGALHVAWKHKRTYLAGRPTSIIKYLFQSDPSFAADYPDAEMFMPFIPAGDHPDYPSGSCTIYSTIVAAADAYMKRYYGVDNWSNSTGPLEYTMRKGTGYWQPDFPSKDTTLHFSSLKDFVDHAPISRVYAGVHFLESGEAGVALGKNVGPVCVDVFQRLMSGNTTAAWTDPNRMPLSPFF